MDLWQSLVLGLVQGVTEFLPISSTAHLRIVPALLGWKDPGAAFTAIVQLGSVVALLVYFWRDLWALLHSLGSSRAMTPDGFHARTLLGAIALGSIPICALGYLGKHWISGEARSLWVIAASLLVVGLLLWWVDRRVAGTRSELALGVWDGLWVGLAQSLALIPGVSRSGISLIAGMSLRFRRETAARFSFLLGIPALCAAGIYEIYKLRPQIDSAQVNYLLAGTLAAFLGSYLTIEALLRYLKTRSVMPFAIYRIALALVIVGLLLNGKLNPLG